MRPWTKSEGWYNNRILVPCHPSLGVSVLGHSGRFLGSGSPSRPPPTVSEPQASGWVGRTTERNEEPQEWIIKGRWSHHNVFHSFPLSFFVGMRPPSLSSGVPWRSQKDSSFLVPVRHPHATLLAHGSRRIPLRSLRSITTHPWSGGPFASPQ